MEKLLKKFKCSNNLYVKTINDSKVYIFNSFTKTSCYLSSKEWFILSKLDGKKNYYDLFDSHLIILSEKYYILYIEKLIELNLLDEFEKSSQSLFYYKIKLFNPNDWLDRNISKLNKLIKSILLLSIPMVILGIFMINLSNLYTGLISTLNIKSGIILYIVSFIFLATHELSHGVVAKKKGAEVVEIGILLYSFLPFIYVTIAGIQTLNRKSRIAIALAGVISNLFFIGIILILMGIFNEYTNLIFITFLLSNLGQVVINSNFFFKVDSYYILENYLNIHGLYNNSRRISFFKNMFNEKNFLVILVHYVYGIISFLNTTLIPLILIIIFVSHFWGGVF